MFDFSTHMDRLIRDIARHTPPLGHIDCDRVLVAVSQQRKFGGSGLYAKVIPLRFEGGGFTARANGAYWAVPPYTHRGRPLLYIVAFCLPRFLNMPYERKGETIFHELYHISPAFDGDLRRFPGKYYQHGPDAAAYDRRVLDLFRRYEGQTQARHLLHPLRSRFHHLEDRHGSITGQFATTPTPVRVARDAPPLPAVELRVRQRPIVSARSRTSTKT